MKIEITALLRSFYANEISDDEFISKYARIKQIHTVDHSYCLKKLEPWLDNKSDDIIEEGMMIGFALDCFTEEFSGVLCKLVQENWHIHHEDIATVLKKNRDPLSSECLYKATSLRFAYLDYEETFQFARKYIKALAEIGDNSSIDMLNKLAENDNDVIRGYAKKELGYKNLI